MKKTLFKILFLFAIISFWSCEKDANGNTVAQNPSCPTGYTGVDCLSELIPSRLDISGITVKSFPSSDNSGSNWDFFDNPDLYIEVYTTGGILVHRSNYYSNTNPSTDRFFPFSATLTPPNEYVVYLYDYDSASNDDYIGRMYVRHKSGLGFPNRIPFFGNGISLDLHVTYNF